MTKHALVLAVAAAALSTAAYAGDSKSVQMTDEQMDQVTAAGSPPGPVGLGVFTAGIARTDFPVGGQERHG